MSSSRQKMSVFGFRLVWFSTVKKLIIEWKKFKLRNTVQVSEIEDVLERDGRRVAGRSLILFLKKQLTETLYWYL